MAVLLGKRDRIRKGFRTDADVAWQFEFRRSGEGALSSQIKSYPSDDSGYPIR